jgi:predicted aminopeptidase
MLKVLEEEQNAENEREKHFIASTMDEKKKLEKQYGMERAKAQARIQKLSE